MRVYEGSILSSGVVFSTPKHEADESRDKLTPAFKEFMQHFYNNSLLESQIQRLNDAELEKCVPPNASWHTDYRDTAYVYVGGLPFELSEGDVLIICSQYGNPVHINLIRDKETGKSRGFAFVKYEDQRSCDLAVDNLSGASVLGRTLTIDHTRYKLKEGEVEGAGLEDDVQDDGYDTDREGDKRRKRRRTSSIQESQRPQIREEIELVKLLKEHDDDDPMKAYLVKEKKEQIAEALMNQSVRNEDESRKQKHRSRKHADDAKVDKRHRSSRHDEDQDEDRPRRRRHKSRDDSLYVDKDEIRRSDKPRDRPRSGRDRERDSDTVQRQLKDRQRSISSDRDSQVGRNRPQSPVDGRSPPRDRYKWHEKNYEDLPDRAKDKEHGARRAR